MPSSSTSARILCSAGSAKTCALAVLSRALEDFELVSLPSSPSERPSSTSSMTLMVHAVLSTKLESNNSLRLYMDPLEHKQVVQTNHVDPAATRGQSCQQLTSQP